MDDYCPRERRVTNHAIVAMVEDDIKQTRCTTCDAEHPYKGGKAPRRRRKDAPSALYNEVLAGLPDGEPAPVLTSPDDDVAANSEPQAADIVDVTEESMGALPEAASPAAAPQPEDDAASAPDVEEGPVHRPLIRATLPRPEGQKDTRPLPEFTIRQSGRGNGQFRGDARMKGRAGGPPNGNRAPGGPRFGGGRPGHGRPGGGARSHGGGFRSSQSPRHGGKKRSR
ncbi:MAG TPA: hypothetical protein VD833_12895 [Vicinamibacterales bacterium]|nr:hypothetical protein [Vicinamibacterales bacterium]